MNSSPAHSEEKLFQLTWNEILYDGGLAAWIPRSSFRWLTICICLIGVLGRRFIQIIKVARFLHLGNILAAYTLFRPRMRILSTYTYLTALCLSNTITLISVIIFESDVFVQPTYFNCFLVTTSKAFASTIFALSTWITVCFTIDRYIMICFPFIGDNKCTRRNAISVIIICLLFALTYLIPQLLAQKCHPIIQYPYMGMMGLFNETLIDDNAAMLPKYWVSGLSELGKSLIYRLTVTLSFNCFLVRIIPFCVIFHLNVRLIQTLSHTHRQDRQLNPYEQKRHDLTYMLVIVISTYLVCIIPSIPFAAFFAYDPHRYVDISFHHRIFQYLDEFAKFLLILNSASQCYLYIFFGKRFRRELTSFLCCVCVKYFYMPIPHHEQSEFNPQRWNSNDFGQVVLRGEWSIDEKRHSINAIEFTFHYARQSSRISSSLMETVIDLHSDDDSNPVNFTLLKRLKTRFEQIFLRIK